MKATLFTALAVSIVASALGCATGGGVDRPTDEFAEVIVPLFEEHCSSTACHGVDDEAFAELDPAYFAFPLDAQGHIRGEERLQHAFDRARHTLSPAGPIFADLIRKPLDESLGGSSHRGGVQFRSMNDPALAALMSWAEAQPMERAQPLSSLAQRYAEDVQPLLARSGCMITNCHGSGASNSLIFDPGVLGEFDDGATLRNYEKVAFHLNLDTPDPRMARIVRKIIPVDRGGIFHRGGNELFEEDDPDLAPLLDFMQHARVELGVEETGVETGIVFAATDPTPRELYDIGAWQPGGDIYTLIPAAPGGDLRNLTAAHHTGPADVRDPSVSYDGTRIAFAMRRSPSDCLNLYVMNMDGSGLTQITRDTGTLANGLRVSNVEPLWGPDDRIYFTSTRSGVMADGGRHPLSNIHRIDADGSHLVQLTYSADNELAPAWRAFHQAGEEPELRTLDLTFTAVRGVGDRRHAPLMRVPPDFRADYHPHFGTQHPDYQVFTAVSAFPDDREVLILMDEANRWEGGALALIDRNLGPSITDGGEPSVLGYVDPLVKLDVVGADVQHRGSSPDGYYRDPQAMPDGTVVVSFDGAAIDHADPTASPDPALYRLTLREREGNAVVIDSRRELVDIPGKVETDPTPIMVRRREEIGDPYEHLTAGQPFGELLNFDMAVMLTVAGEDSPSNQKSFDETAAQIRMVRFVEQVAMTPADYPAWPDTSTNRIGRGSHGMRRIIGEMPTAADQSFNVELPAAVPFYVQALGPDRIATFTHNLSVFVLPGEHLKNVTRREVWNNRCGGCHGSRSGRPSDTVGAPDVLTQASRVLSNYDASTDTNIPPVPQGIAPDDRIEVDFERDVQPIFDDACVECHDGDRAPDLSARPGDEGFSGSYEALTGDGTWSRNGFGYVDPESMRASTSYLAEVLVGRDLDAPRGFDSEGCAGPERLSLAEAETLFRWMDLGASFVGIGPRTTPTLPEL